MEQVRRNFERRGQELGAFVREQRLLADMSLRKLAEASGVSNPYLSQIERGLRRPSADILRQLARGLDLPAETLYARAGMLERADAGPVDVAEAIRRAPELTEAQKRTLLHVYESFRRAGVTAALAAVPTLGESDGEGHG